MNVDETPNLDETLETLNELKTQDVTHVCLKFKTYLTTQTMGLDLSGVDFCSIEDAIKSVTILMEYLNENGQGTELLLGHEIGDESLFIDDESFDGIEVIPMSYSEYKQALKFCFIFSDSIVTAIGMSFRSVVEAIMYQELERRK